MEASEQRPTPEEGQPDAPVEGQEGSQPDADSQEPVVGSQGEPIEQDEANIGVQPDGSFRQSAPPPDAQSGVPIAEDREAGVQPGERREPEGFAGQRTNPAQPAEAGVGAPAQEEQEQE